MSYRLYVRSVSGSVAVEQQPGERRYSWALLDSAGHCQTRGEADSQDDIEQTLAQNAIEHSLLIGLIPGDEAAFCLANIPAKQQRFIAQALPYAVEEQLAQDIETLHLALGNHGDQGYRVAAIDRERMANWVGVYSGWRDLTLSGIYADASLLPPRADGWSACVDGEVTMLLGPAGEWLSVQTSNLSLFLQTLLVPGNDAATALTLYLEGQAGDEPSLLMTNRVAQDEIEITTEHFERLPVELLALSHQHPGAGAINLCQGNFATGPAKKSALTPWRPLILVAAAWLVLQLSLETGLGWYYQNQADNLNAQAMSFYRQAFPDDRRTHPGNARRVVEGQLRQNADSGPSLNFITLMKFTGQQYAAVSGSNGIRFNSLNYNQARGELVVDLRADSYDLMSRLRNGLAAQGLDAQIGSVVNEAGEIRGRLTVSGG
ncbi:type II secretion system protein GspL [Marinobacter sp. LV10MA510-1]|uniref:type II secretion system protein GspL n=1 Tax=Marinobacter sp. LV10MA510-1 TaxID=1415567 RepID=UPI000BF70D5F|nr:type II secretion system protein GspL [Marinobacter sp. LV10MA510-1]PFG08493.1 general secretion pathway protein L [Marinobacter sp. LV10MA510-1]